MSCRLSAFQGIIVSSYFQGASKMQHYSDELKAKMLTEFKQKQSVTTLSKQYIISRTTIYRWLKETEISEKYSSANNKEIKRLLRRVERLEEII